MDYIKHFFGVDLTASSIRTLSKKDNGALLYPYKNVVITIHEVHLCPFCEKVVQGFDCDCKAFKKALKKLQESYGDDKHESSIHGPELDIKYAISKSISDFQVKTLNIKEIDKLGRDVWDYANRYTDPLSDRSYLVTPASQKDNILYLICKDLTSKVVYRFETLKPEYTDKAVFLGIYERKIVANPGSRKIGNYHFENHWRNLAEFENWNKACEALKNV